MRKLILLAAAATFVMAASGAAEQKSAPAARSHRSDSFASVLGLRLRSIEIEIDTLRDRELISTAEARELRAEAQRLERRLYKLPERQVGDVELAVDRLRDHLRLAAANAGLGDDASGRRDFGRFDDGERYRADRDRDYEREPYRRADPRGDPFQIWEERDSRGPH